MSFMMPGLLWLLLPLIGLALWRLKKSPLQRRDRALLFGAMALLVIALSQPYTKEKMIEEQAYGLDVVVAVDVSHSMSASDIAPSRFEAAKGMVRELLGRDGANRYAILAFTSRALPLTPLTADREILSNVLDSLEMENVLTKSTDLMAVLKKSAKILKTATKPVVIFSDGGEKRDFSAEIAFAKKEGIKVLFVPVATASGAKLFDRFGEVVLDDAKRLVISHQNRYVKRLTDATGGRFLDPFDAPEILGYLAGIRGELSSQSMATMGRKSLFFPFVLGAFVLFMLTTIRIRRGVLLVALLLVPSLQAPLHAGVLAFWYEYQARNAYRAGEYKDAAAYYEKLAAENERYEVAFNLANSYYKSGRFEEATILYEAIKSSDPAFKSDVYYNLGNAQAKSEAFKKAERSYLNSLLLGYGADADHNREVVKRAKKGYDPDSLKKKGSGKKDKAGQPKKEGKKKGKKPKSPSDDMASKKLDLSKREKQMIQKAAKKKPLSYKQYRMINERAGSSEKNPW